MFKLIGIKHKPFSGEIDGKLISSDNFELHLETDTNPDFIGLSSSIVKIKATELINVCGVSESELTNWLGKEIDLQYVLVGTKPRLNKIVLIKK